MQKKQLCEAPTALVSSSKFWLCNNKKSSPPPQGQKHSFLLLCGVLSLYLYHQIPQCVWGSLGLAIFNRERVALFLSLFHPEFLSILGGLCSRLSGIFIQLLCYKSLQLFIHPSLEVGTITDVAFNVKKLSEITIFVKRRSGETAESLQYTGDNQIILLRGLPHGVSTEYGQFCQ